MTLVKKLMDCIKSENTVDSIRKMDESGDLSKILPITSDMKSVGECKYHVINCFEHSILAVKLFEDILKEENFFESHLKDKVFESLNKELENGMKKIDLIKLGIFLHDMGKPIAQTVDDNGRIHFKKHEILGANKSLEISKILNLSELNSSILYKYIRYHMSLLELYRNNDMSKERLFNIFDDLKDESIDIFIIGYVDIVSTRKLIRPDEDMGIIKSYMNYAITNYIYRYERG